MSRGIAIVGMACEYPDIHNPAELWENVLAQRRAFRRFPPERLNLADYHSDDRSDTDRTYGREGAFLEGYEFDRVRFRVAGRSYRSADLAHWLALDVAARALENAGFPEGEGLPRESTGVLLGNTLTGEFSRAAVMRLRWPYVRRVVGSALLTEGWSAAECSTFLGALEHSYKASFPEMTEESLAGGLSNTIAGRICNHFDLNGGGFTVDGACASSLLAVGQACSALAAGDLDVALAGGVDLSLDPFELVGFARNGALAPEEMRVYDARSAGFFPGEGCGFVVLLRERDAVERGCRVYATIRGWGMSSDGSGGITRPEAEGQLLALRRAYRRAGFGIGTVGYFEGHGTGTAVGDATELVVLSRARREEAPQAPPVPLGSVKANFGHTKAAAGVAGLIKASLTVHHRLVPPATGRDEPHPELTGESPALRLPVQAEPWPEDAPVRAGVSAMGFGGINVHLVIEGESAPRRRLSGAEQALLATPQDAELFQLTATGSDELLARVERLGELAGKLSRAELTDVAATLARRHDGGRLRAAVVAGLPAELERRLAALSERLRAGETRIVDADAGLFLGAAAGAPRIGLLFPGQGSPAHLGGGVWRRRFAEVEAIYAGSGLPDTGDGVDTAIAQPAIVSASLAGLAGLAAIGLDGVVAVGHSLGELSALSWAGVVDGPAVLRLSALRGQAMAELGEGSGAMAAIGADAAEVAALPGADAVSPAGYNTPRRTVISGEVEAIEAMVAAARERGLQATRLRVSHAFHSPLVAAAAPCIAAGMAEEALEPMRRTVVSTVNGRELTADDDLRALLVEQVTSPVRFTEAIECAAAGVDLWLEVGPGRVLTGLLSEIGGAPAVALDAGSKSLRGLLAAFGAAHCLGADLDPGALFAGRFSRPFDLDRPLEFLVNPCEVPVRPEGLAAISAPPPVVVAETPAATTAAAAAAEEGEPLDVLRRLVAERTELPPEAVAADSRLLSDLHLNSIAVGELVTEAARRLRRQAPASPTDFADATVEEVAAALGAASEGTTGEAAEAADADRQPPGVDAWVRAFAVRWVERPLPRVSPPDAGAWRLVGPSDHPLREPLASALVAAGSGGVALLLPAAPEDECVEWFLDAARDLLGGGAARRLLVVHQGGGGGGFGRTLHLEMPEVDTSVVDLPFDDPRAAGWAAAEAAAVGGFCEARYDGEGRRWEPRLSHYEVPKAEASLPLGPDDLLLVTGGGKGIASECAFDLARRTGARLLLLGRSRPEDSPELTANLERMRAGGVTCRYLSTDVTDAAAVAAAVRAAEDELGVVTAVLHGAGRNHPRLLAALDAESFRATLAPKVAGLINVLDAVDRSRLRLLVTFGSIIGRAGMRGEADYAVANEWLTLATERFAEAHPDCRCLAMEWSVWSGVGMGERLGRLEGLIRQGITPIPPDRGVEMLATLLSLPDSPVTLVVSGRFGAPPTLRPVRSELPLLRFLERPRAWVPGVELVIDSEISADNDPYLADHVFRGDRLFPAVMGMEAMAQAASVLDGSGRSPVFEDLELSRPVVVPEGQTLTLRVAALVRQPGKVDVVLRSSATGFQVDYFRATCRFDSAAAVAAPRSPSASGASVLPLRPEPDLYGGVFFHQGRFRRIAGYRELRATECLAEISPDGSVSWFGRYLPGELLLGDPAARDAALHGIQACVPHATILPIGADRVVSGRLAATEPFLLAAHERHRDGDLFVYDLQVLNGAGEEVERWEGLRLKAVDRNRVSGAWQPSLLAPYVERRLEELLGDPHPAVAVELHPETPRRAAGEAALRRLMGPAVTVYHRPDGKPETDGGGEVSLSHTGPLVLVVAGGKPLGCDVEPVEERSAEVWGDLLGTDRRRLAEVIAGDRDEGYSAAATRVWAAAECLKKAGMPHDAPLVLDASADDGWLLLRCGEAVIGTLVTPVAGFSSPLALAVLSSGAGSTIAR